MNDSAGRGRDNSKAFRAEVVRLQRVLHRQLCNLREETEPDHLPSVRNHISNQIKAVNWMSRHLAACEGFPHGFKTEANEIQAVLDEWSTFLLSEQSRAEQAEQLLPHAQKLRVQLSNSVLLAGCELLSRQLGKMRTRMKLESWSSPNATEMADGHLSGGTPEFSVDKSMNHLESPVQQFGEPSDGQES